MSSKEVGRRLSAELERVSGDITAVASRLNKSRNTIYNWCEKGNIPADQLALLAQYGVDVLYVLTGQRSGSAASLAPDEAALVDNYRHSAPEHQASLRTISAALAKPPLSDGEADDGK